MLRDPQGRNWARKGKRIKNILGGELCRYRCSFMGQNMACLELLKKVKTMKAPISEAFYFSCKVTVGKWIVDEFYLFFM